MATVTLSTVWFHDATDLSTSIEVGASNMLEQPGRIAPVRRYAGGRFRLVTVPGVAKSYQLTFLYLTRTNVDQIRAWVGKLLLMRDTAGRKIFGRWSEPTFNEIPIRDSDLVFQATLTFDEVTHSEAV